MPSASDNLNKILPSKIKKTAKVVSQIMTALKNSPNEVGPTMIQIFKFISKSLNQPATKRQVMTALKRGVEFGILKENKGHYLICKDDKSLVQNVVPLNKAKLPVKKSQIIEKVEKRSKASTRSIHRRKVN